MPQPNSLVKYTMDAAGAAVTWAADDTIQSYVLNGSATLVGSFTFAQSGTPQAGMAYVVDYNAQMTLNGQNITIFGRALTQEEALKKFRLIAIYDGSAFQTWVLPETSMTGRFYNGVKTNTVLAAGGTISLNPALDKGYQVFTSAVAVSLLAGYAVTSAGTPQEGDEFYCLWAGGVTPNGQTVTIFGQALSDSQVLNGGVMVHVVYSGSAWVVLEGATIPSSSVVSKTYAQLQTLVSAGTLQINTVYFVSDRNIWIKAISGSKFELQGSFKMLAPDYQNSLGNFGGTWISTMGAPNVGDVFAYNNFHWENLTGAVGTAPTGDAVNWLCAGTYGSGTWKDWVNKTGVTYVEEIYSCEYDFTNDWVQLIHDKRRGNRIGLSYQMEQTASLGYNVIDKFQWGNNSVFGNIADNALISNANSLGAIAGNVLAPLAQIISNTLTATSSIVGNVLHPSSIITTNVLAAGADILYNEILTGVTISNKALSANVEVGYCQIGKDMTTAETMATDILGETFIKGLSTIGATLDLDDAAIFAATVLTIPVAFSYVGVFTLTSAAPQNVVVIANTPTNHPVTFVSATGKTYTFTSDAIATAGVGDIVRTAGAGNDVMVGRASGTDKLVIERSGNFNRISYADILT